MRIECIESLGEETELRAFLRNFSTARVAFCVAKILKYVLHSYNWRLHNKSLNSFKWKRLWLHEIVATEWMHIEQKLEKNKLRKIWIIVGSKWSIIIFNFKSFLLQFPIILSALHRTPNIFNWQFHENFMIEFMANVLGYACDSAQSRNANSASGLL